MYLEICFYEGITDNKELKKSIAELDSKADTSDILNLYCHEILADEMDIDFLYASTGRAGGCYVVLNDKCVSLSRQEPYGW